MAKKTKMLHTPDPVLDRLIKLATKELKQLNDAKADMNLPRRFTVQGIVNHASGCCSIRGTKHHFMNFTEYGYTGAELTYLASVKGRYC